MRGARLAILALPLAVLAAGSLAPTGAQEQAPVEEFVLGSGGASGTVVRAGIFYGGLDIAVPLGQSASSYDGRRARALGALVNASGAAGITGVAVDGTAPIVVDSQNDDPQMTTSLVEPAVGTVSLEASDAPTARSEVSLLDVDLPGLLRIEGGRSTTSTQIVEGRQRVAEAAVSISSLSLGGGVVELKGLRWEASHRSGAGADAESAVAAFTVGSLSIGGVPVPVPADQLGAVTELANSVLKLVGLTIDLPAVRRLADGSVDISPIRVTVANSVIGSEVVGPLLGEVRPLLHPVIDALVSASPELGLVTLLADLGLGVADGSGGVKLSIGGANAVTDGSTFDDPLAAPPIAPPPMTPAEVASNAPSVADSSTLAPSVAAPSTASPAPVPSPPAAMTATGSSRCALAASPRRQGGCRSANVGAALAVGLAAAVVIGAYEVAARRRSVASAVTVVPT